MSHKGSPPSVPPGLPFYVGNAVADGVRGTGWFIGKFEFGTIWGRHQEALEVKWGSHARGESRPHGLAPNGAATTISILVRGLFQTTFVLNGKTHVVTMNQEGDYIIFGPDLVHGWEALEDSVVLSVRFPSVNVQ